MGIETAGEPSLGGGGGGWDFYHVGLTERAVCVLALGGRVSTMRAMRNLMGAVFIVMVGLAGTAAAQTPEIVGERHGVGLGIEQNLGGLTGAAFSFDAGRFRVDAIFGLAHYNNEPSDATLFGIGGRFFYKLHELPGADFSVGGGVAILQTEFGDNDDTTIHLEGIAQVRVFVVPNVAISGSFGVAILSADDGQVSGGPIAGEGSGDSVFGIGGQLLAGFGAIYYFE